MNTIDNKKNVSLKLETSKKKLEHKLHASYAYKDPIVLESDRKPKDYLNELEKVQKLLENYELSQLVSNAILKKIAKKTPEKLLVNGKFIKAIAVTEKTGEALYIYASPINF